MHNPNLKINCLTAGEFPEDCTPEGQELVFTAILVAYGELNEVARYPSACSNYFEFRNNFRRLVAGTLGVPSGNQINSAEWIVEYRRWIAKHKQP